MKIVLCLLSSLFLLSISVSANTFDALSAYSAKRKKNVDYSLYKNAANALGRGLSLNTSSALPFFVEEEAPKVPMRSIQTAEQRSAGFMDLDLLSLPEVSSYQDLKGYFNSIRDDRFLRASTDFPRRISWMYPDDGCFIRAELMRLKLEEEVKLKKIFIFGNLNVESENAINGEISWWYHVAPVVRLGEEVFVLDPAINPKAPLLLGDWVLRQVSNIGDVELSICDASSVTPNSLCEGGEAFDMELLYQYQYYFLDQEWIRQSILRGSPVDVLGENPPWKLEAKEEESLVISVY